MRYEMTMFEHLDRAAEEISNDHPMCSRFALILIDNGTELAVTQAGVELLDAFMRWGRENEENRQPIPEDLPPIEREMIELKRRLTPRCVPLSSNQIKKLRSRFLNDRLSALTDLGFIASREQTFISCCHDYRNDLYHNGFNNDPIIRPLAIRYFHLCCSLLSRLPTPNFRLFAISRG